MNILKTDKCQKIIADEDCFIRDTSDNSLFTSAFLPLQLTEDEIRARFVEINKNGFVIKEGNYIYTKLQIRMAMRSLGIEDKLTGLLNGYEKYRNDWNDAKEIDLYDDEVQQALGKSSITQKNIDDIIQEIKGQANKYIGEKLTRELYQVSVDDNISAELDVLRSKIENI